MKTLTSCILIPILILLLSGCLARPTVTKSDPQRHEEQNRIIYKAVEEHAETGDWLVIRGYKATDNLVAEATGIPLSHVGIIDMKTQQVIEAEGKGVHISSLSDFIDKSYRLLVIRPRWRKNDNGRQAMDEAAKLAGKNYDFPGTVGFNYPDKYYCSELAITVYRQWFDHNDKFPDVIKPGEMYLYGTILYDSLPRDLME